MTDPQKDRLITIRSAAERLACSERYVYTLIYEGRLRSAKIGAGGTRVYESSLDAFIASSEVARGDYFAPTAAAPTPPEPAGPPARSTWMTKK